MTLAAARDISLILLLVPTCLCALVPAAMAFGAWYVAYRVNRSLPPRIRSGRSLVQRLRDVTDRATGVVTRPIYAGEMQSARLRAMWRELVSPRGPNRES